MNLNKQTWNKARLVDVCEKAETVDYRKQVGKFNYVDIGSVDSELNRIAAIQEVNWRDASSRARQIIEKYDTLFSTVRVNLRRVALVEQDIPNGIASTGFTVLRAKKKSIRPLYLFYNLVSQQLVDKLIRLQVGTAYPAVTDRMVFDQEILVPPLDEQERIVALFQSIEQAILHAQEQEEKLGALQRRLANGLANQKPTFGNLLSEDNCTPHSFGEISECIEEHDKTPLENGLTRFVGLENIEPENLTLHGFGNIEDGTTFSKRFAKGDVLFGKRRAYLRKVAVADFDGICSSDILVLRANTKAMLSELLPYYASSDAFLNHAVTTSAGSLSPRTKWRDLAGFELSIPHLTSQERIVDVFNQLRDSLTLIKGQTQALKQLKQQLLNEILGG